MGGYFLVKGYWISDQEFIAAGTTEQVVQRQTKDRYDRSKEIVILHTNDGGVTWSEIYNSPGNGNDYYFSSRDVMWLVNMDGKLYKIAGKLGPDL